MISEKYFSANKKLCAYSTEFFKVLHILSFDSVKNLGINPIYLSEDSLCKYYTLSTEDIQKIEKLENFSETQYTIGELLNILISNIDVSFINLYRNKFKYNFYDLSDYKNTDFNKLPNLHFIVKKCTLDVPNKELSVFA